MSDQHTKIRRPESSAASWKTVLSGIPSDMACSFYPGWQLAIRDLRASYRINILGYAWIFLPPLVTTIVWLALNQAGIASVGSGSALPYTLFVATGTILWSLFTDALNSPKAQVGGNMDTLANLTFPPEALLVSGMLQVAVNFLVRCVMLAPVCVWIGFVPSFWSFGFLVAAMVIGTAGFACGVFISPFTSIYKDLSQAVGLALPLAMFTVPVVYAVPHQGILMHVMALNPLTYPFLAAREFIEGNPMASTLSATLAVFLVAVAVLYFSWAIFKITLIYIVERK